jgi:hypothetical protein
MLIGFKKQFAPRILDGSKIFTIRNERKVPPKIGETIHMYSGLRTKYSELISKEHKYTGSQLVRIYIDSQSKDLMKINISIADNDGSKYRYLKEAEQVSFAKHDGFRSIREFGEYWLKENKVKTLIAYKVIYHWTDLRY